MMKPLIPPSYYSDQEIFKQEQVILFQNLWNFVGFKTDLENHNDYICTEVGGQSVIIQNFQGELKAFTNVCSHRFSQIRQQPKGNGPLRCPYHSWVYNSEGIPVGIPHQSEFADLTDVTKEGLRLERWLVETCGTLVFVKRHDDGVTLKEYLAGVYDKLKGFSESFGTKLDCYPMVVNANWKIVLENTLEGYHVNSVHQQTFAKSGAVEPENKKFIFDLPHSGYTDKSEKVDPKQKRLASLFANRQFKLDVSYWQQLVFPNLTLAVTSEMWFSVHTIRPSSPSETQVTIHLFLGKLDDSKREHAVVDMSAQPVVEFTRKIWEEDKPICEQVHLGMLSRDNGTGIFSREEQRIYEFHKAYLDTIKRR